MKKNKINTLAQIISITLMFLGAFWIIWLGNISLNTNSKIGLSLFVSSFLSIFALIVRILIRLDNNNEYSTTQTKSLNNKISNLSVLLQNTNKVTIIKNLSEAKWWENLNGEIKIYNAPWILPGGIFIKTFTELLTIKKAKWVIIYFKGFNKNEKSIAEKRHKRMIKSLSEISKNSFIEKKQINVFEAIEQSLPNITFILYTNNDGNKIARIYINELTNKQSDVPRIAFDIFDEIIYNSLEKEFDNCLHTSLPKKIKSA